MNYYNFTAQFPAVKKSKMEKSLDKRIRYNDKIYSLLDWIALKLQEGCIPEIEEGATHFYMKGGKWGEATETKPETIYKLVYENSYNKLSKTEYDFALYLYNNNITTAEAAEALKQAETDRIIKDKAEAETKEKADREAAEQAIKDSDDFKAWLKSEAENYNDNQKLEILKQTYLHYYGYVPSINSIKILVMIDNFDNERCKAELISWLHHDSKASKKAFEIITGIKLHDTDKKTREILNSITSKDFNFSNIPASINFRKPAQETIKETFYILNQDRQFEEVLAEPFNKYGYDMFIMNNDRYKILEAKTGLLFASGKTKTEAMENLKAVVDRMGIEEINQCIIDNIQKYGISPKYQDKKEAV